MIPFNKPYLTGKETFYIEDAVKTGKILFWKFFLFNAVENNVNEDIELLL